MQADLFTWKRYNDAFACKRYTVPDVGGEVVCLPMHGSVKTVGTFLGNRVKTRAQSGGAQLVEDGRGARLRRRDEVPVRTSTYMLEGSETMS